MTNAAHNSKEVSTKERLFNIKPNEKIQIDGQSFDKLTVDIINGDVVLHNPDNGEKLIFPGLALFLFDPAEAPEIIINGQLISPDMFLAKMGLVGTATEGQYLSFSTLDATDKPIQEAIEALQKIKDLEEKLKKAEEEIASAKEAQSQTLSMVQSTMMSEPEPQLDEYEPKEDEAVVRSQVPEGVPSGQMTSFSSSSSSSSVAAPALVSEDSDDGVVNSTGFFGFKTFLLQVDDTQAIENIDGFDRVAVYGGGGSDEATFNPSNVSQIQSELIDYSANTTNLIIYADSAAHFTSSLASRVIEISANLPEGFAISEGRVSGLPAGFSISEGVLQADGSYLLDQAAFNFNDRGDIQITLIYPIPSTDTFELDISFVAEFDSASGLPVPTNSIQEVSVSYPVEVKDVYSSSDLNYINSDGDLVWVLSNQINGNTILSGTGNDIIYGGFGLDSISSGSGDDIVYSSGNNDIIDGGAGSDTLDYSTATDNIAANLASIVSGYYTVSVGSSKFDNVINIENIHSGSGNDTLTGNDSNNILRGGAGNDVFSGGLGADTFDGGSGTDSVSFISGATTGMTLDLNVVMSGSSTINVGTGVKTLLSIENIVATDYADIIIGSTQDNNLSGAGGADSFTANSGINYYDGGFNGSDTSSADSISYVHSTAGMSVNLSGTADSNGYYTLNAGSWATDKIKGIENLTGSTFSDTITGNASDNIIYGLTGDDVIDGSGGNDTIYGGGGSDTLTGNTGTDILRYDDLASLGVTVTLSSSTSGTVTHGSDTDTFSGFENIYLSSQDDIIYTSSDADIALFTLAGNDYIYASAGNDVIDAGIGTDTISYSILSAGTSLTTTLNASGSSSFSVTLAGAVSATHTLTAVETIIGTDGDDTFINGTANHVIDGGGGSNNTLSYALSSSGITVNMGALSGGYFILYSASGEQDSARNIQTLIGTTVADILQGSSSSNTINGGTGNDTFIGSRGGDTYNGGSDTGDIIDYYQTSGLSSVNINLSLSSNQAQLSFSDATTSFDTLTSIENVYGTAGNDTIIGDSNNNIIRDYGGSDTLNGGLGTDTLDYSGLSSVGINASLTSNVVIHGSDTDAISGFENLIGSEQADTLTGDGLANTLTGGAGADTIYGGGGNDTLSGGNDNDFLYGEAGNNTLDGGSGTDTAYYSGAASGITANLSTGSVSSNGYGGVDTLSSIEGLIGSNHADVITLGVTTISVNSGDGNDTINSAVNNSLRTIGGGNGIDTLNMSTAASGVTGTISMGVGSFTVGTNTDQSTSMERFILGSSSDSITIDTHTVINTLLANAGSFDSSTGSDIVRVITGSGSNLSAADIDGDTMSSIFRNIEQIDFRATSIDHGTDLFDINSTQIATITDSNDDLTILIDGTNVQFSDFNITGTYSMTSSASQQVYTFTDMPGATLTIQVS